MKRKSAIALERTLKTISVQVLRIRAYIFQMKLKKINLKIRIINLREVNATSFAASYSAAWKQTFTTVKSATKG